MDVTRTDTARLGDVVEGAVGCLFNEWVSATQIQRMARILRGFVDFCDVGFTVRSVSEVSPSIATSFVNAVGADGSEPSVALRHLRRSALRLLIRAARREGYAESDPTLDLHLPARSPLRTRPLTDEEVTLCRAVSAWTLTDGRRAAAWALAEATCRSVELAQLRRRDVDLDQRRVWIHGGRTTIDRWGTLNDWGCVQLERRLSALPSEPDGLLVYEGAHGRDTGQVSACIAVRDVLVRASLGSEPGVRPASVAAWAGRQVLDETGRIDEVARRLGMSSLDRTVRFIGWSWNEPDTP